MKKTTFHNAFSGGFAGALTRLAVNIVVQAAEATQMARDRISYEVKRARKLVPVVFRVTLWRLDELRTRYSDLYASSDHTVRGQNNKTGRAKVKKITKKKQ